MAQDRAPGDDCARAARCKAEHLACSGFQAFYFRSPRWALAPRTDATWWPYEWLFLERLFRVPEKLA